MDGLYVCIIWYSGRYISFSCTLDIVITKIFLHITWVSYKKIRIFERRNLFLVAGTRFTAPIFRLLYRLHCNWIIKISHFVGLLIGTRPGTYQLNFRFVDRGMRLKSDPDPTWFLKSKNNHDRKIEELNFFLI